MKAQAISEIIYNSLRKLYPRLDESEVIALARKLQRSGASMASVLDKLPQQSRQNEPEPAPHIKITSCLSRGRVRG